MSISALNEMPFNCNSHRFVVARAQTCEKRPRQRMPAYLAENQLEKAICHVLWNTDLEGTRLRIAVFVLYDNVDLKFHS